MSSTINRSYVIEPSEHIARFVELVARELDSPRVTLTHNDQELTIAIDGCVEWVVPNNRMDSTDLRLAWFLVYQVRSRMPSRRPASASR